MSDFLRGELAGINSCVGIIKHKPNISINELEHIYRNMIDSIELGLKDNKKKYLEEY